MTIEYDLLSRILNSKFLSDNQDKMIEAKENNIHKKQCVDIDDGKRRNLVRRLYRFDLDKNDFLPFFNNTHEAPEGLRKFCDYILLVEYMNKTYVLLIELKRGEVSGADKQLNATEVFMEFLYKTAERISKNSKEYHFNSKNMILRKIIIKEVKSNKVEIKGTKVDKNQDIIPFNSSGLFPLVKFL